MKLIKPNILSPTDGSFSRASVGTYIDADNILKIAPTNTPRFNYKNGNFEGILYEPESTNLVPNSEVAVSGNGLFINSNVILAPDRTMTGDSANLQLGNFEHYFEDIFQTFSNPTMYVWSAFVKKGAASTTNPGNLAVLRTNHGYVVFNYENGFTDIQGNVIEYGSELVFDNWYRIWMKSTSVSAGETVMFRLQTANKDNQLSYPEYDWTIIYAWGRQIEVGTRLTSYIKTTGSPVTRAADTITGSGLIYTNAVNADLDYSATSTYSLGNRVSYAGKVFESLQNANIGHDPSSSATWWLLIGPDNKHAALDNSVSTLTTSSGVLTLVIKPGSIDSCGLVDMEGNLIEFAMMDQTDGLVFYKTVGLSGAEVNNWYDYFFLSPLSEMRRTQYVLSGLPSQYLDSLVTIRIKNGTNTAKLGLASFGKLSSIGEVQYGASAGIVDYSVKSTDEYGNTSLLQRNFSKRLSARCFVPNKDINRVQRTLYSIRATPVVWVGVDDPTYEEAMIVWGFYKDFTTEISYPTYSLISIEIEGLS